MEFQATKIICFVSIPFTNEPDESSEYLCRRGRVKLRMMRGEVVAYSVAELQGNHHLRCSSFLPPREVHWTIQRGKQYSICVKFKAWPNSLSTLLEDKSNRYKDQH